MDTASLPPLLAHSTGLNHLAFRADGARIAVADTALVVGVREGDRLVWVRSLASIEPKVSSIQRTRGLAFSPDGGQVYALTADRLVALDAETGDEAWHYQPPRMLGFLVTSGTALAVRPDGLVAASFDNGAIGVWEADGALRGIWKDIDTQRHLAFLPNGDLVGDDSFGLSVFDVATRRRVSRTPLRDRSFALAVDPDGVVAVRTLHEAWQISPAGEVFARSTLEPGLPLLTFSPTEPLLALGGSHAVTFVGPAGTAVGRGEIEETTVTSLAYAPDGRLYVGGADGSLRELG